MGIAKVVGKKALLVEGVKMSSNLTKTSGGTTFKFYAGNSLRPIHTPHQTPLAIVVPSRGGASDVCTNFHHPRHVSINILGWSAMLSKVGPSTVRRGRSIFLGVDDGHRQILPVRKRTQPNGRLARP